MGVTKKKIKVNDDVCKISFFQIFRYATWFEILVTISGTLVALISGFGACYNLIQLGELSTSFVERTTNITGPSSHLPLLQMFGGGRILENATHEENMQALLEDGIAMTIGMFITTFICIFLCFVSIALLNWSALRQITRIRIKFLDSVLRQNMTWYDTNTDFNLASRMSEDMLKLREGMGEKIGIIANLVGTAVIGLVSAFPIGWQLALACIIVLPISVAASVVLSKYQTKSSVKEMNFFSKAGKQVEEVLKSVKTVVAFSGEEKEIKKYNKLLEPAEKYGCKRGLYNGIGNGIVWLLTFSVNAIGMMYGTRLVLRDLLKPAEERLYQSGDTFSIVFNIYMATQSITFCVPHGESFANAKAAAANIFKIIERKPDIDSMSTAGLAPRKVKGEVTLENIHFSYPSRSDVTILKNFSLNIKAGEVIALVGSSGCGKSTILQLIQRLYDPHVGTILLDGRDVKTLNLPWLRSCLGVVGQEPALFRGTIHDNIAIGAPEATRADVQKVAEIAYAHDFISKLPNGYDTLIGERGASLSGGQKQRIAIARSLLREPAVLLLDEATSALDPYSEKQVQAALDRASVGRTTIVVSHRLSTIVNADRIVCMDQGAIVEEGTHEELMKKRGAYWTLVTTGRQVQETDLSEPLPEEELEHEKEKKREEHEATVKRSVSRRSTKSISKPTDLPSWMTPRLSIASVMTSDFQHYGYNSEDDNDISKDDDEGIKTLSQWEVLKLNAPEWPLLVTGSIAAFIQGACFPVFALLNSYIFGMFAYKDSDEIIYQNDLLCGIILVVAVLAGIAMCLQSASFTSAGLKMTSRLRSQCFSSLLRQEIGYYDREDNTVGALCVRLTGDAAEVQGATGLCIGLIIQGITSVLIGFIMGSCYNWKITLVGVAFLPIMVGSIWLEGIISQKSQVEERAAMEAAAAIATEAIISIRTVQSLGVEPVFLKKFEEVLKRTVKDVSKKARWRGLVLGVGLYVPFMAYCSATAYGTYLMTYEDVIYRDVLLVNTAVMYGAYMLGQSLVFAPDFSSAKRCGARIMAMINRKPKVNTADGLADTQWNATGDFNIKNVEFSYPTRPSHKVLKGINLKVDKGKMIALVGSSGCGKSTILQLIQRFYDPDSGSIELDDKDIKESLTLPRLRRQLGVVQQEPVLFDGTLAENIAYGDNSRKVTMHDIMAAAKAANIHQFIVSLPKGYETTLGYGGAQLSGGQKQRICIARALIRSPRLLLLDEATSALDANSEKVVSEALEKAAKGRTCISIAHRLSTIKDADLICVLDKGNIVEQGTHKELIALRGMYWRMNKTQHVD